MFNQEREKYCVELANIIEALESKKQKTTENISYLGESTSHFEQAVESLNESIISHNEKTDNFQTEKDKAVELIKIHNLSEISPEVESLKAKIEETKVEIRRLMDGSEGGILGIRELKQRIKDNKAKVSSEHKACDKINRSLSTFLGRNEIIFEVAPEGGYLIKRKGSIAKNLSEGEKTAIAFVHFVVHLDDQDFDKSEGIIVVDDPISSLDSNSTYQAFAFLKNAVKDGKQVFIFTHNFGFLKLLLNWLRRHGSKRYFMLQNPISDGRRAAVIVALDSLLENHESEYHYLFKRLFEFEADGSIASVYDLPNVARKVLDTFLMFRVPSSESVFKKLEKLDFDENKKTAIYKFTNDMSHITGDGFDPSLVPETQNNVKSLLELIESVFPEHYQIMIDEFQQ